MKLNNIDVMKLRLKDGRTLKQAMVDEGNRLKDLLHFHLLTDALLNEPHSYAFGNKHRTGMLEQSITVDLQPRYENGRISIKVTFKDERSGASGYGVWNNQLGDLDEYNLAFLFDQGYRVDKDVWFKNLKNFGFREASHFIQNAIDDFNAENELGIYIDYKTDVHIV